MRRVFPAARIRAVRAMPSATEPGGIPASAPPAGDPAMPELRLLPGRHKRVRAGHPWVFSNEIAMDARARGLPPGGLVRLAAANGEFVALAGFNPRTLIAARVLARDPAARIDRAFLARRLAAALELRERLHPGGFYRLVHAEADGLPGVVVDRFGDLVSVQLNTATAELLRADLLAALQELLAPRRIVLRNDAPSRALEGLDLAVETPGAASDDDGRIEIRENCAVFLADLRAGQKTGWFFDQRENRARVAGLSAGARVLDAYCYAGGFGVLAALRGAREVVLLDRSEAALDLATAAARRNGVGERCRALRGDAFAELERLGAAGEIFDVVIADPPAFAKSRKDAGAAARGYRKLARLCAALTAPGGILFVASCSHHMETSAFAAELARGLADAGRNGRILASVGAAMDHPVHPHLPESAYLKGQMLQLD
jgi:23S rRNA (cytosine1962-C5)-methyltransferase